MKKLTPRYKKWLLARARNQAKRSANSNLRRFRSKKCSKNREVLIWQGEEPERAISVRPPYDPPSRLCFDNNTEQTMLFFDETRRKLLYSGRKSKFIRRKSTPNSVIKIYGYSDFSKIKEISTAAAVVLTADYERLSELVGEIPPTVDLHSWDNAVITTLYQLGFFHHLGHISEVQERLILDGPTLTMGIISAQNADELARIDPELQTLGRFIYSGTLSDGKIMDGTLVRLLTAISEAITNVTQHAYPADHTYEHKHVGKFWISATANRETGELTIVVYDQGATIPITYPRLTRTAKVARLLKRALNGTGLFDYEDDGTYIRVAMKFGGSRTDEPHRGRGFPQMIKLLDSVGSGILCVRSRGGWCKREPNGRMRSGSLSTSIGGTLIEWTIKVPLESVNSHD